MRLETVAAFRWLGLGVGVVFVVLGLVVRLAPPEERASPLEYEWESQPDGSVVLSDYVDAPDGPRPVVVFEGSRAEAGAWVEEQERLRAEEEEPAEQREVLPNTLIGIGVASILLGGLIHRLENTPRRVAYAFIGTLTGAGPGVILLVAFSYSSLNTLDLEYWQEALWVAAGGLALVGAIAGFAFGASANGPRKNRSITIEQDRPTPRS